MAAAGKAVSGTGEDENFVGFVGDAAVVAFVVITSRDAIPGEDGTVALFTLDCGLIAVAVGKLFVKFELAERLGNDAVEARGFVAENRRVQETLLSKVGKGAGRQAPNKTPGVN